MHLFGIFKKKFVYAKEMKCKPQIPTPYLNNTLGIVPNVCKFETKGKEEETYKDATSRAVMRGA